MKNKKATLPKALSLSPEARTAIIDRLADFVVAECTAIDMETRYDSFLDEMYADMLKGPFEFLRPSAVMKEMCPTDYRVGVADMTGTDDTLREIGGEYYNEKDVEEAREEFVDELKSNLRDAEEKAEDYESRDEVNIDEGEAASLRADIATLEAEIEMCENHSF